MKRSKIFALGMLALLFASSGWLRAEGQQETAEYEKRLAKIKQEIDALKGKIGEEEKKEKTILSSLDRLGFTKSLIRNEQALLNVQL
jgi:hypothetical protein